MRTRASSGCCATSASCRAGGATTTVYPSSTAEDCAFILADSRHALRVRRGRDAGRQAPRAPRPSCRSSRKVILIDGAPERQGRRLGDHARRPRGQGRRAAREGSARGRRRRRRASRASTSRRSSTRRARPASPRACACSTSAGPTPPTRSTRSGSGAPTTSSTCGCRCAHSFGKVLMAGHIASGSVTAVDGRIPKIVENLAVVRPTFMAAVPRIFEKVYNKILEGVKQGAPIKQQIFQWAIGVGKRGQQAFASAAASRAACSRSSSRSPTSSCSRRSRRASAAACATSSRARRRCRARSPSSSTRAAS